MALALVGWASAATAAIYIGTGLTEVKAEDRAKVDHPQPVQLLFVFKTKGAPNAAATKLVKQNVFDTVKASGLFSEVSQTPTANGAILSVVIDNVVDPEEMRKAEAKGALTGATFFVAGTNVTDHYVSTVDYVAGPNAAKISKTAQQILITQLGIINYYFVNILGFPRINWVSDPTLIIPVLSITTVWWTFGFPMLVFVAGLHGIPEQLYEAAAIDGANWWQRIWYVTLPMMRNIIAITTLFSLIVTFANFDIVRILTAGGPLDHTHIFATWAFRVGIEGSDVPLGASVSLFMVPILAIAAIFILRDVNKRGNEA